MPIALGLVLALGTASAAQEAYPTRPITMIVPFAAGGASDVIARIVAEEMAKHLGQRIVHENVGGAGGTTALTRAARAAPDGYTIFIGNSGTNAAAYSIYPDLRYTPASFSAVGLVARTYSVLAVKRDFPAPTLAAFIEHARANPGAVRLGHAGVGSQNFLICRAFLAEARVDITLVSYRGAGPALNDLIGGHIDGVCDAATSVAPAILAGQARGLAVASPGRAPTLPGVPTAAEAGLPGFQMQSWNAIFAPAGTPAPIIARLNAAIRAAVASDFVRARFGEMTAQVPAEADLAPEVVPPLVEHDIARFRDLMKER
ncbi:tripartite tricarboxylate transporter substrate-binding protein [Phreatobacter sp.]|uniref:tripartite tricarboxylate transporter substrate-binding protein n=1 Tax=Phreatobacter sp. TaxID=1966341 RepID=UPI0025DA949C|nr:tripartite tricarboxylate transporter substrate-binding protein [Phreatobacter sp.]